jgi:hypothetical protein
MTKTAEETPEEVTNIIQHLKDQGFNLHSLIKNKYDLTEEEQMQLVNMTPKEKKEFLKLKR